MVPARANDEKNSDQCHDDESGGDRAADPTGPPVHHRHRTVPAAVVLGAARGVRSRAPRHVVEDHAPWWGVVEGQWHRPPGLGVAPDAHGVGVAGFEHPHRRSIGLGSHGLQGAEGVLVTLDRVDLAGSPTGGPYGAEHGQRREDDHEDDDHRHPFNRTVASKAQRWARWVERLPFPQLTHPPSRLAATAQVRRPTRGRRSSGMASRLGLARSRPESTGSTTPQSAPTTGSSQARPSSSAGL